MSDYVNEVSNTDTGHMTFLHRHGVVVDRLLRIVDCPRPHFVVVVDPIRIAVVHCQGTPSCHQVVERILGQAVSPHVRLLQMGNRWEHPVE
ncbi:hypothetical protein D3C85_1403800 [compost metagenome]